MTSDRLCILTDYKGQFWSSVKNPNKSMKTDSLKAIFEDFGYDVSILNFSQVDMGKSWENVIILYTSQEDHDLRYKSFIEDIVWGLRLCGAVPVPDVKYLRAHHNKVFMEILRQTSSLDAIKAIKSRGFGTLEEFKEFGKDIVYPAMVKPSAGAMSKGVTRASGIDILKKVSKTSFSFVFSEALKNIAKAILNHPTPKRSLHRNKYVIQNYIEGLDGDYKILVFGQNYYVLQRKVKGNDYRASGSGIFSWPKDVNADLLEFAEKFCQESGAPFMSLDVGTTKGCYYLIEFQAVMFGMYTLEYSGHYFRRQSKLWNKVEGPSELEVVFANAVHEYLSQQK